MRDPRLDEVAVRRHHLSKASENGLAATDMALAALQRAERHVFSGSRAAAINELNRIGFELMHRRPALAFLAGVAESAPALDPDGIAAPGHGAAA